MQRQDLLAGAQLLVDALRLHGTDTVFGVRGESYLAVLDALHDVHDFRLVICRQEGGAAYMADAYSKLTGKPGICFVSRGPGATNASLGIHTAYQDSSPVILFIGQIGTDVVERWQAERAETTIPRLKELGVNLIITNLHKGFGLKAEADDIEATRRLTQRAHKHGIRVGGYVGATMMAETFFAEEPDAPNWRQVNEWGR